MARLAAGADIAEEEGEAVALLLLLGAPTVFAGCGRSDNMFSPEDRGVPSTLRNRSGQSLSKCVAG